MQAAPRWPDYEQDWTLDFFRILSVGWLLASGLHVLVDIRSPPKSTVSLDEQRRSLSSKQATFNFRDPLFV